MGYIRHHAIIVTAFDRERLEPAHARAVKVFGAAQVTQILVAPVNGYATFFVGPDGSKEGWAASDEGDEKRAEFIAWMRKHPKGYYFDWAEVQYYDESGLTWVRAGEREAEA